MLVKSMEVKTPSTRDMIDADTAFPVASLSAICIEDLTVRSRRSWPRAAADSRDTASVERRDAGGKALRHQPRPQ